ncbi:MAG: peptidoglycan D,D-transpeptidase FtsI family protein [Gammaproteobacteria bacterium WSBS_2016_MAG_OTU1]
MIPRNFQAPPPQLSVKRRRFCFVVIISLFVILAVGGPIRIAAFEETAQKEAALRHQYKRDLFAHRGDIVDANGQPLAISTDVYDVRADMAVLAKTPDLRDKLTKLTPDLAAILDISPEVLEQKFSNGGRAMLLKKSLPPSQAQELQQFSRKHGLYGLLIDYNSKRYYPQREYAASVVGYTNYDDVGRAGIEFVRHAKLSAEDGEDTGIRARTGGRLGGGLFRPSRNGDNITLSIDSRLQFYAYEALEQAMERHDARAASAAVMDARTGDILALASVPGFNPNNIRPQTNEKNHALTDAVEPGSLAKPFIIALAVQNNFDENEIFPTDKPMRVGGVNLHDTHIRESLNMKGILRKSSNIGAALLAHRLGGKKIWELYRRLEFGASKSLNMPGESAGRLTSYKKWRKSDLTTHAYGYGFSATLMQLLAAYSVFASDGLLIAPRLEANSAPWRRRVLPKYVARRVRSMLESVTEEGGTATRAAILGYKVAGKTGTAKKQKNGSYEDIYRAFFVGMAPASNPRYVVAVMIDEPQENGFTGGAAAAPVFQEIMRQSLRLNGVPPDNINKVAKEATSLPQLIGVGTIESANDV